MLGVDLAKSLDYTSFAVVEMVWSSEIQDFVYHLKALDRIRGVDYPKITDMILATAKRLEEEGRRNIATLTSDGPHLCMDASGLGAPIRDYLKQSKIFDDASTRGKRLYPVVFTGGEAARRDAVTGNYNISKTLIISNFLSLMQHRRFDYAPDLETLPLLEKEIASFKYHLTPSGHTGFDAEQGAHDDLICATCIPLIIGEWLYRKQPTGPLTFHGATGKPAWADSSSIRGGQNWLSDAARHHGGGASIIGGVNHR
jgi:hypothetical protein